MLPGMCGPMAGFGSSGVDAPPLTNLWAWWSAEKAYTETSGTPTTLVTSDGADIGSLLDRSGNGRHLYQTSAGAKPTFKTGILNSKPAILSTTAKSMRTTAGSIPAGDLTAYLVFKGTTWASGAALLGTDNGSPSFALIQSGSGPELKLYRNNAFGAVLSPSDGSNHLLGAAMPASGSSVARLNAGSNVTGTTGTGTGGTNISLLEYGAGGGGSPGTGFTGYLMEVLLYSTNHATDGLDTGDGLLARKYLDQRWALGLGL